MAADDRETLESRVRELTIINESIRTLTSTLELSEILRTVLERIKLLTHAEALSLLLYDGERDELVFAATETLRENLVAGLRVPESQSIAGWVARTGRAALVNDVARDPRFYPDVDRISHFGTRSLLAVPLRREGRILGVLEIANRYDGGNFEDADLAALETFAAEREREVDPESFAQDGEGVRAFLADAVATVPSEAASLLLYDPGGRELVFSASRTMHPGIIDGLRISCDRGIAGWVARRRVAVRIDDVENDPRHYGKISDRIHFKPKTMICVPMISKNELRGVIQVINKIGGTPFTEDELRLTQTLADHAAIAIENASLYRQAYVASVTDDLTGLGNTRWFNRRLAELAMKSRPLSLLVLDLDNFKRVVDTWGHLAGSRTIGHLGRLLAKRIRPGDVAARFGGDEFVILLPDTDLPDALAVAESVRATIEEARSVEGLEVDISAVTASVGVATIPNHASDAEGLFRAADDAMYGVKRTGKNSVAVPSRPDDEPGPPEDDAAPP